MKKKETKTQKINKNVRDQYGNMITSGDYISYPGRKGSSTYMRTAKVLDIKERNLDGDKQEYTLSVAVAMAPRWWQRKNNPNAKTTIRKTTVSSFCRATIIPKSYIQNDKKYRDLLEY